MFDSTPALLAQIQAGEDSFLELKDLRYRGDKVEFPHRKSMADELAAMANSRGGVVVLGVDDRSKAIVGIPQDKIDSVGRWVEGIGSGLVNPELPFTLHKMSVVAADGSERFIIRIDVPKSVYVHKSPNGYFHRVGSSKREMSTDALARNLQLRSRTKTVWFDERACAFAPRSCLHRACWQKFKTPRTPRDEDEFLTKIGILARDEDGGLFPSVAGLLLACPQPREFFPNAYIQAVAYRGTERNAAYQLDARDIAGPLDEQIAGACKFVRNNMRTYAVKRPARQDIPQYSQQAVFEALVNAVAHRDYSVHGSKIRLHMFSDRLELFSPGALANTLGVDTLPFRQATRNELIASLLARCPVPIDDYPGERQFLMDKRGEGVPIILAESEKLSGRTPEYRLLDDAELLLTMYPAPLPPLPA